MKAKLATLFWTLAIRNFRLYIVGLLVKTLGVWMMFTAQSWLVLGLSGDSPAALGIVTAMQFAPSLILTLTSGRLADRFNRRALIFAASSTWVVVSAGMSVIVLTGVAQLWQVFVFAALLGVANAIEQPVRKASTGSSTRRRSLVSTVPPVSRTTPRPRLDWSASRTRAPMR